MGSGGTVNIMRSIPTGSQCGARSVLRPTKLASILSLILTFTTLPSCRANRTEIEVISTTNKEAEHEGAQSAARGLGLRIRWSQSSQENDVESQIGLVDRAVIEQRFPKISVVDRRAATSSDLDSELVVNQILLSHPHVGAIFALDSRGTIGAYYALNARSLTNRIKIVGVQQTEELANAIRLHQIDAIIAEDGYQMGYQAVEAFAHGEAKSRGVLKLAPMLITADNVDSTAARPFLIFVRPAGWRSDYQ